MGDFRSGNSRGRFGNNSGGSRGRFGGDRRDSFVGGRSRDSGRGERRPMEMHDAICSECQKACQVPFKPTSGKPVLCSDCFKKSSSSSGSFNSSRPQRDQGGSSQSGISSEQFNQINKKLDKIIGVLEELEMSEEDDEEDEED